MNTWLKNTINPPKDLLKKVQHYRKTLDKRDKLVIPCITVSASFNDVRNLDNIKKETNLICLDIDRDSNPCLDMVSS